MAVVSGTLAFGAGGAVAANCEGLVGKNFGDATISAATNVAPPFNVAAKDPPTLVSVNKPFCRVEGVLKPSRIRRRNKVISYNPHQPRLAFHYRCAVTTRWA
jgi:hypothetical protein